MCLCRAEILSTSDFFECFAQPDSLSCYARVIPFGYCCGPLSNHSRWAYNVQYYWENGNHQNLYYKQSDFGQLLLQWLAIIVLKSKLHVADTAHSLISVSTRCGVRQNRLQQLSKVVWSHKLLWHGSSCPGPESGCKAAFTMETLAL